MPIAALDGLSLWYRWIGERDSAAEPAILIQGLGMQATDWPEALLGRLAAIRPLVVFDNRDAGLSSLFGPASIESLRESDFPDGAPLRVAPTYDLGDMARDVLGLMDALSIRRAHLVGFSMGGMIAQWLAATAPARVASLAGLMTSAGQEWLESSPGATAMLRRSILAERNIARHEAYLLAADAVYAGPSALPERLERLAQHRAARARGHHPAGIWRQARAMRAAGARQEMLAGIEAPVLMLHGDSDPVIAPRQGAAMRDICPGADFRLLPETGHVLTELNGGPIAAEIAAFWEKAVRP